MAGYFKFNRDDMNSQGDPFREGMEGPDFGERPCANDMDEPWLDLPDTEEDTTISK